MRTVSGSKAVCRPALVVLWAILSLALQAGCGKHLAGRPQRIRLIENEKPTALEQSLMRLEKEYDRLAADAAARQNVRDQYVRKMIAGIDGRYHDFLDDLVTQRKGFDASADITAIGLDTASVLFRPATTKSILAGLSALTTAGKTAINKVYFYEQTLPVLISQMESDRQAVLADITEGLNASVQVYPLRQAVQDLNRYYFAGTIDGALAEIQKQAARKSEQAQERIRREVEDQLRANAARRDQALAYIVNDTAFRQVRSAIGQWWEGLDEESRGEQLDVIASWATARGVSLEGLRDPDTGTELHPDRLKAWLDALDYSESHRLLLTDIAQNVEGLVLPQ